MLELISKLTSDLGVQNDINLNKINLHGFSSMTLKKYKKKKKTTSQFGSSIQFIPLEMSTYNPFQLSVLPLQIFGPSYGSAVPTRLCLLVLVWKRQWSAISIQGLGNKNVWTLKYTNAMILELKNSPPSPICQIACHKSNVERLRDQFYYSLR